ncbi:T9SS type A sorting domain-containing protein [Arachidicoccus ginsenosidivorans]
MQYIHQIRITVATLFSLVAIMVTATAQLTGPVSFSLPPNMQPANLTALEYYFDADPGLGHGIAIPVTSGATFSINQYNVSIGSLAPGIHRLYLRAENSDGSWGLTTVGAFYILSPVGLIPPNTPASAIVSAECYFDQDPGHGQGSALPIPQGTDVNLSNLAIRVDTLTNGIHRLYTRVKNAKGIWSITSESDFYIVTQQQLLPANEPVADIVAAEYYLDTDPGPGHGVAISVQPGSDITVPSIVINIAGLALGVHHIYARTKNREGKWSITTNSTFYIVPVNFRFPPNQPQGQITAVEYFFDHDPGFGNGTMLSVAPTTDLTNYQISADISSLKQDSVHTLYIRTLDGWSETISSRFTIGTALPVKWLTLTAARQPGSQVLIKWTTTQDLTALSFNIERSLDGQHFLQIGHTDAKSGVLNTENNLSYTYLDISAPQARLYYRIKETDKNGQFSYSDILLINNQDQAASKFYIIGSPVQSILRVHLGLNVGLTPPSHPSSDPSGGKLQVFDLDGRMVLQEPTMPAAIQQLNVSRLAPGIYILRYRDKTQVESGKFIKQ